MTEIQKLQTQDGPKTQMVAYCGDGINDAVALVQSDVGMALQSGADVAIASAGIVLSRNSPAQIPTAVRLSKATVRVIRQVCVDSCLLGMIF